MRPSPHAAAPPEAHHGRPPQPYTSISTSTSTCCSTICPAAAILLSLASPALQEVATYDTDVGEGTTSSSTLATTSSMYTHPSISTLPNASTTGTIPNAPTTSTLPNAPTIGTTINAPTTTGTLPNTPAIGTFSNTTSTSTTSTLPHAPTPRKRNDTLAAAESEDVTAGLCVAPEEGEGGEGGGRADGTGGGVEEFCVCS
ncbi:hypothetical protein H0H87_009814 [Tephrocybe sp. NHM501043]|nr:hypothetical protein H0H87_009814 [Tephrocybe sp. NHM501043]